MRAKFDIYVFITSLTLEFARMLVFSYPLLFYFVFQTMIDIYFVSIRIVIVVVMRLLNGIPSLSFEAQKYIK